MKSAAIMLIFVVESNNMTIVFTINYYASMKRTYINNDCTDFRQIKKNAQIV